MSRSSIFGKRLSPDLLAVAVLIALWMLFFWRLFTPNPANALSVRQGDFSGQFVAWASYQSEGQRAGQVPLWNPYNNGGHPFLADTQSQVYYPPRMLILALLNADPNVTPGKVYLALEVELALHFLIASLLMYAFVRRLLIERETGGEVPALAAALTFAYGGFLTGYPILQPAALGAVVWCPLMLLGILEATRERTLNFGWLILSGIALGVSFHAGSPQFTHWGIVLTLVFLAWRVHDKRVGQWFIGAAIFGGIGGGLAAVQLLPGLQFYALSARRSNFTFDLQGNGFPPYDLIQMVFPGWLTVWSPLFIGLPGLALATLAVWRRVPGARLWAGIGGAALIISFGRGTVLWDILYNLPLGFSLFRQQERAAFPMAVCAAILVGLGTFSLFDDRKLPAGFIRVIRLTVLVMAGLVAVFFVTWQLTSTGDVRLRAMTFSLMIGALTVGLFAWIVLDLEVPLPVFGAGGFRGWGSPSIALIALIVLELFTVGHAVDNYEPGSALTKLAEPSYLTAIKADLDPAFRVDGQRGVLENYGALYHVQDIRGTSPLRLDAYNKLLSLPIQRVWELMAVRYVFTPDQQLPVPSQIVGTGKDAYGALNVHKLRDPRPFARLVYQTWIAADDQAALNALANPDIDLRRTVVLTVEPKVTLPSTPPTESSVKITQFTPEGIVIQTMSSTPAILDLSLANYSGWKVTIDDQPPELLRANLALSAVALPAGAHTIFFRYQSDLATIGGIITLITLVICGIGLLGWIVWRGRAHGKSQQKTI